MIPFFRSASRPLVIVSSLPKEKRAVVADFLIRLNAPVYLECVSGLREDARLQHLRISYLRGLEDLPVDGIFRIGGIPIHRLWRDVETKKGQLHLLSYSHLPWPGASWGEVIQGDYQDLAHVSFAYEKAWYQESAEKKNFLNDLCDTYPDAEPSLVREISQAIPRQSLVYLGNSLPIREWDFAATEEDKQLDIQSSRGMNGIDGQMSTFFGMTGQQQANWCILGDLTTLYDLAAPWILSQLEPREITIVVINNGGGKIFANMSQRKCLQNQHSLRFEHFAKLWGIEYQGREGLHSAFKGVRLIEVVPCPRQTEQLNKLIANNSFK